MNSRYFQCAQNYMKFQIENPKTWQKKHLEIDDQFHLWSEEVWQFRSVNFSRFPIMLKMNRFLFFFSGKMQDFSFSALYLFAGHLGTRIIGLRARCELRCETRILNHSMEEGKYFLNLQLVLLHPCI